jgi:hypothetical protein
METRSAALVLALVYVVLGFNRGFSIYDEAIPVVAAMRILDRDRPYRDFWVIYPPALVMAVLGIRRRATPASEQWSAAFVGLIGLCLLPYAWVNSDLAHIVPA